jgi:hypothetical protein
VPQDGGGYVGESPGGAIGRLLAKGPLPEWMTIGRPEEFCAGIICGDELPSRIAEDHRRRQLRRKT